MSNAVTQSPPGVTIKQPNPESVQDTRSNDSSDDSGSSTNSGSSRSRDSASESKSISNKKLDASASVKEASSSGGSEESSEDQSESGSGDEQCTTDDEPASPELNATFQSAIDTGAPPGTVVTQSPAFCTPRASIPPRAKSSSPAAVVGTTKSVFSASPLLSPPIATPGKNLVIEVNRTPRSAKPGKTGTPPPEVAPLLQSGTQPPSTVYEVVPLAATVAVTASQHRSDPLQSGGTTAVKTSKRRTTGKVGIDAASLQPPVKVSRESKPGEVLSEEPGKRTAKCSRKSEKFSGKHREADTESASAKRLESKRSKKSKKAESVGETEVMTSPPSGQSRSSSPSRPGPSGRIAKISEGRRFQKLAMSRSKHLGFTKDGTIRENEISVALKKVRTAKFNIQPTNSYRHYNRVHGTDLPHIRSHLESSCERYGKVLGSTSELELLLTHSQDIQRAALLKPEAESQYSFGSSTTTCTTPNPVRPTDRADQSKKQQSLLSQFPGRR